MRVEEGTLLGLPPLGSFSDPGCFLSKSTNLSASRKKREEKFGVSTFLLFSGRLTVKPKRMLTARLRVLQRATPLSPPPPTKPPSPSFELGLSSFPPLPGAAGQLKADDAPVTRLGSGAGLGAAKEQVRTVVDRCIRRRPHFLSVASCQNASPDALPGGSPSVVLPKEPPGSCASALPPSFQPSPSTPASGPALSSASGPRLSPAAALPAA